MNTQWIAVGDHVRVQLLADAQGDWLGVGEVLVDGQRLRDGSVPMALRLDTPHGILYTRYLLEEIQTGDDGAVTVRLRALGYPWGRQEYADEYGQSLMVVELPQGMVEDVLCLTFAPVSAEVGGRPWTGFSYAYHFQSTERQVHRMLVHGSWELGGSLLGDTVLQQGQCNMPVYRGEVDTLFTTTCLKSLDQYGSPQGVSFQLAPRGGLIQGFDFQYDAQGALLQYWPDFDSISSLLESPHGSARLVVIDEYRFPLAHAASSRAQHVLVTAGPLAEHEARDLWWEAHRFIYGGLCTRFGVPESVARPELGKSYGARVDGNTLKYSVEGHEVDSTEAPYAIADYVLPKLAAQGIKRYWPEVMSQSDVTEFGMKRKLEDGIHGDLHCASVCATHRFLPAEFWGGLKAWKYMADRAHELGMEIGAWFAPHLSPNSPILREHPEWRITSAQSLPDGGGYGFSSLVSLDWNTGIFDWILADLARWKAEGGLDYLWTDSWSNLGLLQMNYREGMRTNFAAQGRLYGELAKLGIKTFAFESISPFGLMACGFADLRGDIMAQDHAVAGQNDFGWWVGEEDMAFNACMYKVQTRERDDAELHGIQFRLMANRGYAMLDSARTGPYDLPAWWITLNIIYEQVLPHMRVRRLLPDGAGVRWLDGDTQVLWAFRDTVIPIEPDVLVEEVIGADTRTVAHAGTLAAAGGRVYRLRAVAVGNCRL
jgi:hypothetical protein